MDEMGREESRTKKRRSRGWGRELRNESYCVGHEE
jgi:hypothetical protein